MHALKRGSDEKYLHRGRGGAGGADGEGERFSTACPSLASEGASLKLELDGVEIALVSAPSRSSSLPLDPAVDAWDDPPPPLLPPLLNPARSDSIDEIDTPRGRAARCTGRWSDADELCEEGVARPPGPAEEPMRVGARSNGGNRPLSRLDDCSAASA